jgi:flagellar basal-body rod protein FlgF
MDNMMYIAMSGAKQLMLAQASNSNNLANVSTPGFRADLAAFKSLPVYGPGFDSRAYTQAGGIGVDVTPGAVSTTGRELDVAINGPGLLAVQGPNGTEAYTRAGDLQITSEGLLQNGAGHPVLGDGGPITLPPYQKLEIGADGTVSIQPLGQSPSTLAVVGRIKLVNPPKDQLMKGEDGLIHLKDGSSAPADAAVHVVSGALEGSNVKSVDAMVTMIELGRQYEMQVKLMKTAEENDADSAKLMSMG